MANFLREKAIAMAFSRVTNFILLSLILLCVFSYAFFANSAVRTLADLEKTKGEMQSLGIDVSEMEAKRLAVDNSINPELAQKMGFVEIKNQTFIVDRGSNATLSFKTN